MDRARQVMGHRVGLRWWQAGLLAAALLTAIGLWLRQASSSLVFDEYASLYFSDQSFGRLWGWWLLRETNPPLFYSLLRVWRMIVPETDWAMRALPLLIGSVHLALFTRFTWRRFGFAPALLAVMLFALSPADAYATAYVRGYVLAKLAILISFTGLLSAIDGRDARSVRLGWLTYGLAATVAIYCHTTMVLWPVIATIAVFADAALRRDIAPARLAQLLAANVAVALASFWVIVIALVQLRQHTANIDWLQPLALVDYQSTLNLQLLTDGTVSTALMAALVVIGSWRNFDQRVVRLSVFIVVATLVVFKAADAVHPITSDYTLHWCANFTVLLAASSLHARRLYADLAGRWLHAISVASICISLLVSGLIDLFLFDWISVPQDWRTTVRTVAATPHAALLASHESIGVILQQACHLEFKGAECPFPLVVMADPKPTDNWAFGGYRGALVAPDKVRAALGDVQVVYVFSRYFYTPLQHLGLDPGDYPERQWDDGELIGPIPIAAFDPPATGEPPRVPDYTAEYTGGADDDDAEDGADDGAGG
ncbi:hypothetical protein [Novosphingobium sp.]|uniref:hypothetical protein n=1 Tax=Novosphingobium sp. TaxID=1874826 RepID=UPI0038BA3539